MCQRVSQSDSKWPRKTRKQTHKHTHIFVFIYVEISPLILVLNITEGIEIWVSYPKIRTVFPRVGLPCTCSNPYKSPKKIHERVFPLLSKIQDGRQFLQGHLESTKTYVPRKLNLVSISMFLHTKMLMK